MSRKIKKFLFVFFFVFLELFYPLVSSAANWVTNLANWVGTRLLFLIFKIAVDIAVWVVGLAGSLLNWVLSPNFINYSYTNPANNPVIKTGLEITQGFVNMLLVLVLVYIAIATILRLAGYETKKLLVTFIIVALLVNFSPVFCGLIVDASNIVMNFFVQDLKADAFGEAMGRAVQNIVSGFETSMDYTQAWSYVFKIAVMVPFLLGLTFVLLIFTLVFILRYIVIWLLVILSPLAFVCYILPITRKYFEQWWQQFLAWSFIGVTCGFFLYLGLLLAVNIQAGTAVTAPATGEDAPFNAILPYFVALIFLGIGIVFGLQTSAMGATAAINITKTKGKATVRFGAKGAAAAAGWGARRTASILKEKVPEKWQKWGQRIATKPRAGEGIAGIKGALLRTVHAPYYHTRRVLGKTLGAGLIETQKARIKETEESVKDATSTTALTEYHRAARLGDTAKQIGILNKWTEKGDIDELMDKKKFGKNAIKIEEIDNLITKAKKWEADKTLGKAFPHIGAKYMTDEELEKLTEAMAKDPNINTKEKLILSKLKPSDYKLISKEALKDVNVVDAMLATAMGGHISQLIEQYGREAAQEIEKGIARNVPPGETPTEHLKKINPRLHRYFTAGAGRGLIEIPTQRGPLVTPPFPPSPPPPKKPIKGPTIGQEIKTSKATTIGQEIKKGKRNK